MVEFLPWASVSVIITVRNRTRNEIRSLTGFMLSVFGKRFAQKKKKTSLEMNTFVCADWTETEARAEDGRLAPGLPDWARFPAQSDPIWQP